MRKQEVMEEEMEYKENEEDSYVRVIKGDLIGKIYKVFDVSQNGNFIAVGVVITTAMVEMKNVVPASKEDFNDFNQNELSQGVRFLNLSEI